MYCDKLCFYLPVGKKEGKGGDFVILRGNGGILCYGGCWHLHRIESWDRREARIEFMVKKGKRWKVTDRKDGRVVGNDWG